MKDQEAKAAAGSLGVPNSLRAHLPDLFCGVQTFGSDYRVVVQMMKSSGIGPGDRVADVACGKGALALSAARRLGCRAVGIDVFDPFIVDARRRAQRRGLSHRVTFLATPLDSWHPGDRFHAVAMIGLHSIVRAASACRRLVLPGGLLIIDDLIDAGAIRRARAADRVGRALERAGFKVEQLMIPDERYTRESMELLHRRLRANAARLARLRPDLRPDLDEFLNYLDAAERSIPSRHIPAYWGVRVPA